MDSKDFIDRFISFVEREPLLWDKKNDLYGNENASNSAWEHIATKLNEKNEKGFVTGECLNKLWTSLAEVHEQYINNPQAISFEYAKEMKFLGKQKAQELFLLKMSERKAFLNHIIVNVVLIVIYAYMRSSNAFRGANIQCSNANGLLLIAWMVATGLASIISCWTILKDKHFRKNLVPAVIICIYAGICILFLFEKCGGAYTGPNYSQGYYAYVFFFLGFAVSLSLCSAYHFVKITDKSSLLASLKTLCATYFGSAVTYTFFIATIDWTPSFFVFPVWLIVNGKFSIDALCLSWKKCNIEPKNRYTVSWNYTTDQFELVLNGSNPNNLSEILVITDLQEKTEKK